MPEVVLVVDLGSSRMRCVAATVAQPPQATEVASAPYPILGTRGGGLGRSFNLRLLRARLFDVLAEGARAVGAKNVATVAVVAQRGAVSFLDAALRGIYAGPQTDLRAVFGGAALDDSHGERIHAVTGHLPSMLFVPAKLGWWMANRPREAKRIAKACGLDAWAALQLTGALAETPHGLAELGLLDVAARAPAYELLGELDVPPDILPSAAPLGAAAGQITAEAARATGLSSSVEARLAGPDTQAAALGSGRSRTAARRWRQAGARLCRRRRPRLCSIRCGAPGRHCTCSRGDGSPRRAQATQGGRSTRCAGCLGRE